MTNNDQANIYLRTRVMSASPEELRLMLLDGSLKFARMARDGLVERNYEKVYDGVTRCQAILLELINSLDHAQDAALCNRLTALYTFLYTRLMDASTQRDPGIADEVLKLLEYERETWIMLMEQLVKERRAAVPPDHELPDRLTAGASGTGPQRSLISVQG